MSLRLRLAVLYADGENFSGNTILGTRLFEADQMDEITYGYFDGWVNSALGSASAANNFVQTSGVAPSATAVPAVHFMYRHTSGYSRKYIVSALSTTLNSALTSSNPNQYTNVAPLSPYTANED